MFHNNQILFLFFSNVNVSIVKNITFLLTRHTEG